MWADIVKNLEAFPSAVLTGLDVDGYPFSLRCHPRPDHTYQVLRVDLPEAVPLQPGPGCLLCHHHDQRLWNLKSFVVRGELEQEGADWHLLPQSFIPGMGMGWLKGFLRFLVEGRRTTRSYLAQRGLPRPQVSWEILAEMMELADQGEEAGG